MNIIKLESFRQIPADEELCETPSPANILSALNENGVTLISDMYNSSVVSVRRGTQVVNTTERTGLIFQPQGPLYLYIPLPDLSGSAVQMGFRLTLSEGGKNSSSYIRVGGKSFTTPYPDEAASYYFEIFVALSESNRASASLYCNRSLVGRVYFNDVDQVTVGIGDTGRIFTSGVSGTVMLGDMYLATLPYGDNYDASPSLLGSVEVGYSPVTAFSGGSARNSLDKDIVTGLNTSDSDAGYLMLSPSTEAAQVTFGAVDNSNNNVIAVMASVTYRSADAPNNCLAWKVKNGSHEGAMITEDGAQYDTNGWTTVSQSFMAEPGGETPFARGELTFSAELLNQARSATE
ncbi:hypothetical protein ABLL30_001411 [Escherichia coli]